MRPDVHRDHRGAFAEWFRADRFAEATGHRFDLAQANCSVSAAAVVRGIHYADVPPGQAKYVTCASGSLSRRGRRPPHRLADVRPVGRGAARRRATTTRSTSARGSATRSWRSRTPPPRCTSARRRTPRGGSTASTPSTGTSPSSGRPGTATDARSSRSCRPRTRRRPRSPTRTRPDAARARGDRAVHRLAARLGLLAPAAGSGWSFGWPVLRPSPYGGTRRPSSRSVTSSGTIFSGSRQGP